MADNMGDFSYSLDSSSSSSSSSNGHAGLFNTEGIPFNHASSSSASASSSGHSPPSRPGTSKGVVVAGGTNANANGMFNHNVKNSSHSPAGSGGSGSGSNSNVNGSRQEGSNGPAAAVPQYDYTTTTTSRPPGSSGGGLAPSASFGGSSSSGIPYQHQQQQQQQGSHHHQYITGSTDPRAGATGTSTATTFYPPNPPPGSSAGLALSLLQQQQQQQHPPSSSSEQRPPSSAGPSSHQSFLAQQQQQQQQLNKDTVNHDSRTNLWGYSVPSPPTTSHPPQTAQESNGKGDGNDNGTFAFPQSSSGGAVAAAAAAASTSGASSRQFNHMPSHHHHHHQLHHHGHPSDLSISTAALTMPAPPASAGPSGNPNLHLYSGYNLSNTRPMTAPGSSISAPGYYHSSTYGMFSPETYTGAGFPQSFPRHLNGAHAPVDILHNPPLPPGSAGGPPGSSSGPPPGSASSAAAAAAAASILARDKIYGLQGHHYSGLPDEPPPGSAGAGAGGSRGGYPALASTSSASDNIFAHQPPPLSGGAGPVPPFGAQQLQHHHQQQQQHAVQQQQQQQQHAAQTASGGPYGHYRPGTDYGSRRTLEDLEESRFSRPGTSDTARPDTAYSTFSTHSAYSGAPNPASMYHHLTHPSLYHLAGQHTMNSMKGPTYNFIPLPSQPKKRPRRRFEEIERLYDCNYPGCNKAYGTLNHLNAHVSMQKHGPKRLPAEFKEIRKAWRQRKKEAEAAAKAGKGGKGGAGRKKAGPTAGDDDGDQDELDEDDMDDAQSPENSAPPGSSSGPPAYAPGAPEYRSGGMPPNGFHNLTPPSSTNSFPATPGYLNNFHGYYPPPQNMSPNSGAYSSRPSTAPGHIMHHLPFGAMANHPGAVLPGGISPLAGSLPPGYLGARKNSLTSFPPAFDSIQEEGAEEPQNGLGASTANRSGSNGIGKPADSIDAPSHPGYPGNPHLPTPPILVGGGPMGSSSVTGLGVITHSNGNNNHYGHSTQHLSAPHHNGAIGAGAGYGHHASNRTLNNEEARPSTASSPFRFTASGLGDTADAYDSLEGRRSSDGHPNPNGAHPGSFGSFVGSQGLQGLNGGLSPHSAVPGTGPGVNGRWSPDWKTLSHATSHYPQQQASR